MSAGGGTRSVAGAGQAQDAIVFNPFPKVKPEDYIAPRRGPAYQTEVPDWPTGQPSVIKAAEVRLDAHCLHKACVPSDSLTVLQQEVGPLIAHTFVFTCNNTLLLYLLFKHLPCCSCRVDLNCV